MNLPNIRVCPLCGSKNISLNEPDAEQISLGATCVLKCECGAVVTLFVQAKSKADSPAPKSNANGH